MQKEKLEATVAAAVKETILEKGIRARHVLFQYIKEVCQLTQKETFDVLSRVLLAFASIIADFSFFRAVLFSTDMRKKRYWEGVRGKMEERTKAADDYAATFFTKQLMYPERSHGKQSPLQRIPPAIAGRTR